jgi:TnpA family transposase
MKFEPVIINKFCLNLTFALAWRVGDGLGASRFWLWGPWTTSSTKRRRRRTAASAPRHSVEFLQIYFVIINKFCLNLTFALAWRVGDGLGASRFWLWGPWTTSSTKRRRRRTAASAPKHSVEFLKIYLL